jgi:hypothetical protein
MKRHMASHMDPFSYINVMDRVIKSEDGSKVTCKDCGKYFSNMKNIKEHTLNVHFEFYKKVDKHELKSD